MGINVEPNILLIIIGALFVLIGVSGKIFIEKFSVAVSTLVARTIIGLVGLILLSFGIIGPQNIFHSKTIDLETKGLVITKRDGEEIRTTKLLEPWYKNIIGTYDGKIVSGGKSYPAKTTFNIDNEDNITGTYIIEEENSIVGGILHRAKIIGIGGIEFDWKDKGGTGKLRINFKDGYNSFSGSWGDHREINLEYHWYGQRLKSQ